MFVTSSANVNKEPLDIFGPRSIIPRSRGLSMQLTSPHSLITAVVGWFWHALHCTAIMENGMTWRLSQHAAGPEPLSLLVIRRDCLCTRCDALLLRVIRVEESCEISKTSFRHKSGPSWKFGGKSGGLAFWANSCSKLIPIDIPSGMVLRSTWTWLVVSTPLKNINQLGWLFPIYGKTNKNVPNHQPVEPWSFWPIFQQSLLSSGVIHVPVSPSLHR